MQGARDPRRVDFPGVPRGARERAGNENIYPERLPADAVEAAEPEKSNRSRRAIGRSGGGAVIAAQYSPGTSICSVLGRFGLSIRLSPDSLPAASAAPFAPLLLVMGEQLRPSMKFSAARTEDSFASPSG